MLPEEQSRVRFSDEIFSFLWETAKIVFLSLLIIIPIRYFLIQPFFVKGNSMVPNFHDKDYILVDKLGYRLDTPQRGDIVVFRYPKNPSDYFIKRIIGLPGETVQIKNNQVIVSNGEHPSGVVLNEPYLASYQRTEGNNVWQMDDNEYFVLGDNRVASSDSRSWGPLNRSFLSGRAWVRLWPFGDLGGISRTQYLEFN